MSRAFTTLASCLLLASIQASLPLLHAQEATRADFDAFKEAFVGRWVGNLTLHADIAGIGKKGEEITVFLTVETSNDGQTLTSQVAGGKGSGTWTMAYDSGGKRIRTLWSTSGGEFDQGIIYRQGDQWFEVGEGTNADGKVTKFKNTLAISDGGNTHTWTGTSSRDGVPNPPRNDVFRRVSGKVMPPQDAALFTEFGNLVVGRWTGKVVLINDWPGFDKKRGDKVDAVRECKWANDGQSVIRTDHLAAGVSTTLYAWNPIDKKIEYQHASVGGTIRGSVMKLANGDWIETLEGGGTIDGEVIGGAIVYTFSNDNRTIHVTGVATADGKALGKLQDVYQKDSP